LHDPEGLGETQGRAAKDEASPGSGPSAVALFSLDTSGGVLSLVGGEDSLVGNERSRASAWSKSGPWSVTCSVARTLPRHDTASNKDRAATNDHRTASYDHRTAAPYDDRTAAFEHASARTVEYENQDHRTFADR
jgi:hypothetical protein